MFKNSKKVALALVTASFVAAPSVIAGEPANLKEWAQDAGQSIDKVMYYPKFANRSSGNASSTFKVTIDRDGDVISSKRLASKGHSIFNGAANAVVAKADFPDLPESYEGDSLTFELRLNYGVATSSDSHKSRAGSVTSRRIAANATGMTASLRVVSGE